MNSWRALAAHARIRAGAARKGGPLPLYCLVTYHGRPVHAHMYAGTRPKDLSQEM